MIAVTRSNYKMWRESTALKFMLKALDDGLSMNITISIHSPEVHEVISFARETAPVMAFIDALKADVRGARAPAIDSDGIAKGWK